MIDRVKLAADADVVCNKYGIGPTTRKAFIGIADMIAERCNNALETLVVGGLEAERADKAERERANDQDQLKLAINGERGAAL